MKNNLSKFLTSAVYILLGLALIVWPAKLSEVFCTVVAIAAAAIGLGKLIGYFCTSLEARLSKDTNSFAEGLTLIIVAAFIGFKGIMFQMIIPFVLGIMITYKGLEGLQNAINLKGLGKAVPKTVVIGSLIIIVVGLLVMLNPFSTANLLFMILGLGLFISGLTDFIADIIFTKRLKEIKESAVETETEAE